ncbi:MAG: NYN domain-containing protein [Fimbriimonadales bacterium]|jgi:uncharacterized LabA/DUF88 family protein|nr:NYN domain-containing protein [Armatimonadota bacterium]MCX7688892.1 NYN domain-containing protein [Fimbriimonadales bacterium]GBC90594.1 hypothetical protein HRbin14_01336 [bacterium HR14]GIV13244.1 MAG: hypothetical protein KatS3mg021_1526 [Fimbriimonadales bacterium]
MATLSVPTTSARYSALFADLENIYYYLKNNGVPNPEQVTGELIRETRNWLQREWQEPCIIMIGYADFDQLDISLGDLYLMGLEPRTVVSTEHKNAADMRLCIDALEVLYTRPDIQTFVLIAGDRDYIPLVQHLQRQARQVLIVSFRGNLSGDLLHIVGESNFVDAEKLVSESVARLLHARASTRARPSAASGTLNTFNPPLPVEDPDTYRCLAILVNEFGAYHEVWLTPFLRRLNEAFPLLANYERQALISNLVSLGAIRVEKREGNPYPYSVAIINWNHPTVREVNQTRLGETIAPAAKASVEE